MKKFTKILAIILAVMIPVFMFAGCGAKADDAYDMPMSPDVFESSGNSFSNGDYADVETPMTPDAPSVDNGFSTTGSADAAIKTDFAEKIIYSA